MEEVIKPGLNIKDILDRLDDTRNNAVCHIYDLKAIMEMSEIAALNCQVKLELNWISVFNVINRVVEDIHKEVNILERLIGDLRQQENANRA